MDTITPEQKLQVENIGLKITNLELQYKLQSIQLNMMKNKLEKEILTNAPEGILFDWNTCKLVYPKPKLVEKVEKVVEEKDGANS